MNADFMRSLARHGRPARRRDGRRSPESSSPPRRRPSSPAATCKLLMLRPPRPTPPSWFEESLSDARRDLRRLETLGRAGGRGDQRRRARRRPGDRAGLPPPGRAGRQGQRDRPARGDPRPAARRRRRDPHGADVRPAEGADGGAAAGPAAQAGRRARSSAWSTRWSPPPRRCSRRRKAWIEANPEAAAAVGRQGLPDPGRHAVDTRSSRPMLPAFPANLRKQIKGAPMPAPQAIMSAAVEGAQVDFDTALTDRDPVLRRRCATGQVEQEHDQGVLLRPAGDIKGGAGPTGHEPYTAKKVGVLGAGHDGRRHRLRLRPGRHGGRAQGRLRWRRPSKGKAYRETLLDQGRRAGAR